MADSLRRRVNHVLAEFATRVGLGTCQLDDEGGAQFAIDDVLVSLLLDDDAKALLLLASVGHPEPGAEIYGKLLDANLFWDGAGGATLARVPASGAIVLQRSLRWDDIEIGEFEAALQRFVDAAERFARRLNETDEEAETPSTSSLTVLDHFVRG